MRSDINTRLQQAGALAKEINKDCKKYPAITIAKIHKLYYWFVPGCYQTILFCTRDVNIWGIMHISAITCNVILDPKLFIYDDKDEKWSWEYNWEERTITHHE